MSGFQGSIQEQAGGGAEDMLPSHLLPFTSAFDKTFLQRETLKFTEPCFWEQRAVPSCRGMVLVKHGLLEKCLGKGLRGSKLFLTEVTASNARCQQDQGGLCMQTAQRRILMERSAVLILVGLAEYRHTHAWGSQCIWDLDLCNKQ